jgi:hypothetical protein
MSNFEIPTLKNAVLQGFSLKNCKSQFQEPFPKLQFLGKALKTTGFEIGP